MKWRLIVIAALFVLMILDIHVFRHLRGASVMVGFMLWVFITLGLLSNAPIKKNVRPPNSN